MVTTVTRKHSHLTPSSLHSGTQPTRCRSSGGVCHQDLGFGRGAKGFNSLTQKQKHSYPIYQTPGLNWFLRLPKYQSQCSGPWVSLLLWNCRKPRLTTPCWVQLRTAGFIELSVLIALGSLQAYVSQAKRQNWPLVEACLAGGFNTCLGNPNYNGPFSCSTSFNKDILLHGGDLLCLKDDQSKVWWRWIAGDEMSFLLPQFRMFLQTSSC